MVKEKFKISIIDFMPHFKKFEVGKYKDGTPACIGDLVEYQGENNWFISYRYGEIVLKKVGFMAMIGMEGFKKGDFSRVEKTNIFGSGSDWLIIGFTNEPFFKKVKPLFDFSEIDNAKG